ncbi:MAG: hypothetical protein ACLP7P_16025 [Rhodomicrobium sp.]
MRENGTGENGNAVPRDEFPGTPPDSDTELVLDDEISSAATPFLYLLASIVAVIAAYFLYSYLRG